MRGTAGELYAQVGSVGFFYAGKLPAQTCYFETTRPSLGDAHLRAMVPGRSTRYPSAPGGQTWWALAGRCSSSAQAVGKVLASCTGRGATVQTGAQLE